MKPFYRLITLAALALLPAAALAAMSINPPVMFFPETAFGSSSQSARFTITNTDTSSSGVLGTLSLEGDSGDYTVTANSCSGHALNAAQSCYVDVAFTPQANGTRSAMLLFDDSYALAAFLSNHEDESSEALRRMPPVLDTLSMTQGGSVIGRENGIDLSGGPVTIEWTMLGYHDSFTSIIALFNCDAGDESGTCGSSYGNNIDASGHLSAESITEGEWFYLGTRSKVYRYSYTFEPAGTPLVSSGKLIIRFYRKNNLDAILGNSSVSVLLPGNLDGNYYDTSGRRLSIDIK